MPMPFKHWLVDNGCSNPAQHFIAITTNKKAAQEFGAKDEHIFYFWDWVGGRYSLWSAVGLACGYSNRHGELRGITQRCSFN